MAGASFSSRRHLASNFGWPQSVGTLAFALWLVAAFGVGVVRPGELFEIAMMGVAGLLAWSAAASALQGRGAALVALACFAAPLGNTWPARTWAHAVEQVLPAGAWLFGNTSSLLLFAAVAVARPGFPAGVPRLALSAAAMLTAGALLSTTLAGLPESGLQAVWVGILVPIAWGALAACWIRRAAEAVACLTALVAGALVPLAVGVAAYVLEFGVPGSGADLLRVKMELYRPFLIQETTLGNVGHIASLAVLVLVAAAVLAAVPSVPAVARCTAALSGAAAAIVLVLVLERGPIFVALAGLVVVGLTLARFMGAAATAPAAVAAAFLLGVSLLPSVRPYVAEALPSLGAGQSEAGETTGSQRPPTAKPGTNGGPDVEVAPGVVIDAGDASTEVRFGAASTAVDVFADHAPFGVGTGQYGRYDPGHTAAHSLPLQLLAEDGIPGVIGFALLVAAVVMLALGVLRRGRRWTHVRIAASAAGLAAAGGFLVQASLVGTTFATAGVNVLGLVFWVSLALGARAVQATE
jgi:O-antigen ligase/polysaccharide polymerase Wzy-like membrane protein